VENMGKRKIMYIADNIHFPIELSQIEKFIISTQHFNRLHNVLQNSTAYLTYPSNRTSRFSHSLGCMKIAGDIFWNSILNADSNHRALFCKQANETLKDLEVPVMKEINNISKYIFSDKREVRQYSKEIINDLFYLKYIPANLTTKEEQHAFVQLFQALRLAALLHDVGHPPFSHVSEAAIEELYGYCKSLKQDERNEKNKNYIKIIENLNKAENRDGEKNGYSITTKYKVSHENIGFRISEFLLNQLVDFFNVEKTSSQEEKVRFVNTMYIVKLVKNIFNSQDDYSIYPSLYSIINGDLDADRLDYVRRDLEASGINSEAYKLGRLISSYQLFYNREKINCKQEEIMMPIFAPSVRALSTIEKVFRARRELYKYVIYHHRVSKTDCLLKNLIVEIGKKELAQNNDTGSQQEWNNKSSQTEVYGTGESLGSVKGISTLWEVLDPENNILDNEFLKSFLQWDDPWLLSIMREEYNRILKIEEKYRTDDKNAPSEEDEKLKVKLEEILSNRKYYYSLFKRVNSFKKIDDSFLQAGIQIFTDLDLEGFSGKSIKEDNPISEDKIYTLREYIRVAKSLSLQTEDEFKRRNAIFWSANGFFLNNVIRFIQYFFPQLNSFPFITEAFTNILPGYDIIDYLYMPRFYKSAFSEELKIVSNDNDNSRLEDIFSASPIVAEEDRFFLHIPSFYIYFRPKDIRRINFDKIYCEFGEELYRCFYRWFKELI
jgi:hypothetical protein